MSEVESARSTSVPHDATDVATYCVLCNHNCGVRLDVAEGEIVRVRPDHENPFSRGHMCNKAPSIPLMENHAERVRHPMRRRADGTYERVSWDEAIADIATRLNGLISEHGGQSLAACGLGGQGSHLGGHRLLGLMNFVGATRWFTAYAQEKTQHHLIEEWMFDSPPTMFFMADADNSDYLLAIGTNPRVSNLIRNHTAYLNERKRGGRKKLVVVDPRVSEFARDADHHIALRPGSDAYFLLAMTAIIVEEQLVDEAWLAANTRGFDRLREELSGVDTGELARRCDIPLSDIEGVAREFAASPRASIEHGLGAEHVWFSTFVSYLSHLLICLTGNAGREGGNVFFPSFTPPLRSPDRFDEPPRTVEAGIRGIRALVPFHMFSPTLLPEEIITDHPDRIRALFLDTSNPLLSYSDTSRWREALGHLDLLVVVDPAMTESARCADYILPPTTPYQKWGYADFPKRWPEMIFQLRRPVTPVPESDDTLSEPEIYGRIVRAMDVFGEVPEELLELGAGIHSPDGAGQFLMRAQELAGEVDDERPGARLAFWTEEAVGPHLPSVDIVSVWAFCMVNSIMRPAVLKRSLGPVWQEEANPFALGCELFRHILNHPEGVEVGRDDKDEIMQGYLGWEDGKIRLLPDPMIAELRRVMDTDLSAPDPEYPITVALGVRTRWSMNTVHRDPSWRKGRGHHCTLHVCASDAARAGVTDGESVRLASNRGSLVVPIEIEDGIRPGHAWLPNGFGMQLQCGEETGVNGNELTDTNDRDPFTGCPHHKTVRCAITAVRGS